MLRHTHTHTHTSPLELSHNVVGPHNAQFWALFATLKAEYLVFHNSMSTSNPVSGG